MFNSIFNLARNGVRENSRLDLVTRRFRGNTFGVIGLGIVLAYLVLAVVGPYIAPYDATSMAAGSRLAPPSLSHPFGTDSFGRDVFSRVLLGARTSLRVGALAVGFSTTVGVTMGLIAGYYQDRVDGVIMRIVDVMLAFPSILLALIVVAILGRGLDIAILALGIAYTPIMLRVVRGSALSIREEEYVMAAISYGESSWGVMFRDMLPNLFSTVIVQATITFAYAILAEAALSFLGLSAQPPTITWGLMVSQAQDVITTAPWVSVFPGLAITVTVLGLTFLGVGLREALDPQGKGTLGSDKQ